MKKLTPCFVCFFSILRIGLVVLIFFMAIPTHAQHNSVRIHVIDRGQADGILIRTPNNQWVVIDAGTNKQQAAAMESRWGVESVALAIVSHRHSDHLGGMDEIINNFEIDRLVMNTGDCPERESDDRVRTAAAKNGVQVQSLGASTIVIDEVRFTILPPDPIEDQCPDDENNNSIVVRMEFGEFAMLFTGDAETDQRKWLMEHHPLELDVDVLKASHHGSFNGVDGTVNGRSWLDVVSPEDVVISAGLHNRYRHPDSKAMTTYETLGQGNIHCTHRHGTVEVYGYRDGSHRIYHQRRGNQSCRQ